MGAQGNRGRRLGRGCGQPALRCPAQAPRHRPAPAKKNDWLSVRGACSAARAAGQQLQRLARVYGGALATRACAGADRQEELPGCADACPRGAPPQRICSRCVLRCGSAGVRPPAAPARAGQPHRAQCPPCGAWASCPPALGSLGAPRSGRPPPSETKHPHKPSWTPAGNGGWLAGGALSGGRGRVRCAAPGLAGAAPTPPPLLLRPQPQPRDCLHSLRQHPRVRYFCHHHSPTHSSSSFSPPCPRPLAASMRLHSSRTARG